MASSSSDRADCGRVIGAISSWCFEHTEDHTGGPTMSASADVRPVAQFPPLAGTRLEDFRYRATDDADKEKPLRMPRRQEGPSDVQSLGRLRVSLPPPDGHRFDRPGGPVALLRSQGLG